MKPYPFNTKKNFGGQGSKNIKEIGPSFLWGELLSRDREGLNSYESSAKLQEADCTFGGLFGGISSQNDPHLHCFECISALGRR